MSYESEIAAANTNASRRDRFKARAAVNTKYGMATEKRKRGGLAGTWDRNKQVIKPLATIAAGMVPGIGPLLASGVGAAMGGFDRPGKGGVGFDVGGGLKGGISGYGMGGVGAGLKGAFTGATSGTGLVAGAKKGLGGYRADTPWFGGSSGGSPAVPGGEIVNPDTGEMMPFGGRPAVAPVSNVKRAFTGATSFVKKNPLAVGSALKAGADIYQSGANRRQEQAQTNIQNSRYDAREEQRKKLAEMLRPLFMRLQAQTLPGGG